MSALAARILPESNGPDFHRRCEAVALQYLNGEIALLDAVDSLQNYAVAFGLDETLGQDAVQAVIAAVFRTVGRLDEEAAASSGVARSTLDAAAWLFFQVKDRQRFDAWMLRHSLAERSAITAFLKERKRARRQRREDNHHDR
jgi:hypothetical protein